MVMETVNAPGGISIGSVLRNDKPPNVYKNVCLRTKHIKLVSINYRIICKCITRKLNV